MAEFDFVSVNSNMPNGIYYSTIEKNKIKYRQLLDAIEKLKKASVPTGVLNCDNNTTNQIQEEKVVENPFEKTDQKLQQLVQEYISLLRTCNSYEQLCEVADLISQEDYRTEDIILGVIAELTKDCHDLEAIINVVSEEEKEEYDSVLAWEKYKIEILSSVLFGKDEISQEEEKSAHRIILAFPSVDKPTILEELENIDSNYYPMFSHLIELIEAHGADTRCKYIRRLQHFKTIGCLYEAKSPFGGRVVFRVLDNERLLLISAFIKKCTSSKLYIDSMNSLAEYCSKYEDFIKSMLQDQTFITSNDKNIDALWTLLNNEKKTQEEQTPVYKKGGVGSCQ